MAARREWRRAAPGSVGVTAAAAAGIAPLRSSRAADRLLARELDFADHVAIRPDRARAMNTSSSLPTPMRERASARRTSSSPSPNRCPRQLRLQARLRREKPVLGDAPPPSTAARTRSRRSAARASKVAAARRIAHASPEIELPGHGQERPLDARVVAGELARRRARGRRPTGRASPPRASRRATPARPAPRPRASRDCCRSASRIAATSCSSRIPPPTGRRRRPGAPPARQVSGTATFAIDSALSRGRVRRRLQTRTPAPPGMPRAPPRPHDASWTMSSVHADAVLDDDVVEIRLDPHEHFPDDVHRPEVLGVERRGPGAPAARNTSLSCSPTTSFTGNRPGGGMNPVFGRLPEASTCPAPAPR